MRRVILNWRIVPIIMMLVCILSGCDSHELPDISSVSIEKDGTVTHQIIGQFEQNYYDSEGLESLATERVNDYCTDNGDGSVTLQSVEEEDNKIQIVLKYATPEDYSGFNHRQLYVGTIEEAGSQGYSMDKVAFVSAKGEPAELGFIDDPDSKKVMIIATKPGEEMLVNTYGKVLYINQSADSGMDVSYAGKKSIHISNPAKEEEDGGEETLSYIVFE